VFFNKNQPYLHPQLFDNHFETGHFCCMTKYYPPKQALLTGFISAVFATGAFSGFEELNRTLAWGINPSTLRGLTGLLTIVILGVGVYAGLRSIKRANGGKLAYGQAVLTGLLIGLTTGVIMSVAGFIYTQFINPGYIAYMLSERKNAMLAEGRSQQDISQGMAQLKMQLSPAAQVLQALVAQTAGGTVIAAIIGLFVRTKK
jgi:hypothetical protein